MFARFNNKDNVEYAPKNYGSISNFDSNEKLMKKFGFLPIETQGKIEPNKKYKSEFELKKDKIIEHLIEIPMTDEEIQIARCEMYRKKSDSLILEREREKALNQWNNDKENDFIQKIKEISVQIESLFPYSKTAEDTK